MGGRIKMMRQAMQMRRKVLAKDVGISTKRLRRIEKGKETISAAELARFCVALCISADFILGLID